MIFSAQTTHTKKPFFSHLKWSICGVMFAGIISTLSLSAHSDSSYAPLIISYLDRPPYYHTVEGEAQGLLVDKVKTILEAADIEADYREVPAGRILHNIEHNISAQCSIGWFKNDTREKFARFTLPIWRDSPWMVLAPVQIKDAISQYGRFSELLADSTLSWATHRGFSYGQYLDGLVQQYATNRSEFSGDQMLLPKMMLKGRASYMIIAKEEFLPLIYSSGLGLDDFFLQPMADAPPVNERFLMCSKSVTPELIEKINQVIITISSIK
ncbi:MAG: hypothetical protein H7A01_15075 [Hahellaceae bacterium]|nr:hypothetical protein [Hahellaceae bacterium]MCP5210380.1 hypothetical protein [Hahellaceae bacterium]